jgi:hypothetical protein
MKHVCKLLKKATFPHIKCTSVKWKVKLADQTVTREKVKLADQKVGSNISRTDCEESAAENRCQTVLYVL